MITPEISVVVCTFNRAEMLADALASLTRLETHAAFTYEIVVVDNASTDRTPAVVADLAAMSSLFRYVREERKGIVPARNRGIREARGKYIAFFDDDQLALPQWLHALWTTAEERGAGCVGGPVHLKLPEGCDRKLQPVVRMLLGESDWSQTPTKYDNKRCPGAGNMLLAREWLDRVGVFDEAFNVRGEDTDLFLRLFAAGCEAWYAPDAVVLHVMTAQRLEDAYVLRLADWMGGSVAEKEFRVANRAKFAARRFLKQARRVLSEMPQFGLAKLRGEPESLLNERCRSAISAAYGRRSGELLSSPRASAAPTLAGTALHRTTA